ncbi:MAG: hypothetical protein A2W35_01910 [Chloroflexi bacterium RBG_16_57_11]|nr:MAG: hypothetical protein A2W35_01910 [Chloroflexi bacterium RBG_16_57_11]
MVKIGDVFEIPLSDGSFAYGQFVFKDSKIGPLIQIFDLISKNKINIEQLGSVGSLFPPIITGLFAAIRTGMWKIIGRKAIKGFVYPNFVSTFFDDRTGKAGVWFLWNGKESIRLGSRLPDEYKKLEYLMVWSPQDVVKRIETGEYPFPYRELIQNNKFQPKVKQI